MPACRVLNSGFVQLCVLWDRPVALAPGRREPQVKCCMKVLEEFEKCTVEVRTKIPLFRKDFQGLAPACQGIKSLNPLSISMTTALLSKLEAMPDTDGVLLAVSLKPKCDVGSFFFHPSSLTLGP